MRGKRDYNIDMFECDANEIQEGPMWFEGALSNWNLVDGFVRFKDGRVFEGETKRLKIHGKGCMKYADGRTEKGKWVDGVFSGDEEITEL